MASSPSDRGVPTGTPRRLSGEELEQVTSGLARRGDPLVTRLLEHLAAVERDLIRLETDVLYMRPIYDWDIRFRDTVRFTRGAAYPDDVPAFVEILAAAGVRPEPPEPGDELYAAWQRAREKPV